MPNNYKTLSIRIDKNDEKMNKLAKIHIYRFSVICKKKKNRYLFGVIFLR